MDKHLRLENGAAVRGGILFVKVKTMNARLVDARNNFRLEPRQQNSAVVAGRRLAATKFAEFFPVGESVSSRIFSRASEPFLKQISVM
jgi:hypothetical protein